MGNALKCCVFCYHSFPSLWMIPEPPNIWLISFRIVNNSQDMPSDRSITFIPSVDMRFHLQSPVNQLSL